MFRAGSPWQVPCEGEVGQSGSPEMAKLFEPVTVTACVTLYALGLALRIVTVEPR